MIINHNYESPKDGPNERQCFGALELPNNGPLCRTVGSFSRELWRKLVDDKRPARLVKQTAKASLYSNQNVSQSHLLYMCLQVIAPAFGQALCWTTLIWKPSVFNSFSRNTLKVEEKFPVSKVCINSQSTGQHMSSKPLSLSWMTEEEGKVLLSTWTELGTAEV